MNYRCDHVIFLIRWVVLFGGNMYSNVYSMAVAQLLIATQRFFLNGGIRQNKTSAFHS